MVETLSKMVELGTVASDFTLPNANPNIPSDKVSLSDFSDAKGVVIAFICNHCPYVVKIKSAFSQFAVEYMPHGIAVVAISSNDASSYPADGPQNMAKDAVSFNYSFPYLYDESQQTAISYGAVCTPDFYLYDSAHHLVYRGQFDDSRPGNELPSTGSDLRAAVEALLSERPVSMEQKPSIGCSIKWKR